MTKRFSTLFVLVVLVFVLGITAMAQESVEVRFQCYQDGSECEVYADAMEGFMETNPDITVIVEEVPYQFILDSLPVNIEVGEGPDIARITNYPGFSEFYLDMRPYMADPAVLEDNFNGGVLNALRSTENPTGLHGFPDALTATAPFINVTLFDQAGIEIPGEGATWEEWITALDAVAAETGVDYSFAIDNRGHRFAGPAMSMGANFFDDEGNFDLADDEGFAMFAEMLKGWLDSGQSPIETWATGDSYTAANNYFTNVQTVMYFSGSWQVGGFAENIGDAFEWAVAPNPTGPGGSTGVAGGAGVVAFDSGDDAKNAAITAVIEYLIQPEVYAEFSSRTLNIPAHAAVVEMGVEFETDNDLVKAALSQFALEGGKLQDQAFTVAFHPFSFAYFGASNTRLSQYFAGELTVEEMLTSLQADIDDAVANAES